MNTVWTIIGSVGTSLLASGGLVWLCREWISARLHKSIQHEYDKKLADYETRVQYEYAVQLEGFKSRIHYEYELKLESSKKDFQRVLDEHQTRFKYWHEEKAIAIKDFYTKLANLFCEFNDCQSLEEAYEMGYDLAPKYNLGEKEDLIYKLENDLFKDWLRLRLFWENEEDLIINNFFAKANPFVRTIVMKESEKYSQQEKEQNAILLEEMTQILEMLRRQFQASLVFQKHNLRDQKDNSSIKNTVVGQQKLEVKQ